MPRQKRTSNRAEDISARIVELQTKLPEDEWIDLDELDAAGLNKKIIECQVNLVENEREKQHDLDLEAAKNKYAALGAPYKDAKKRLTLVAEYCTLRLEQTGKA